GAAGRMGGADGGQLVAVGAEGDAVNHPIVPSQGGHFPEVLRGPDTGHSLLADAGEEAAVGRDGQPRRRLWATDPFVSFLPRGKIEERDRAVTTEVPRDQTPAAGQEDRIIRIRVIRIREGE